MISTDKLLKCIVCQKSIKNSVKSTCPKGHMHCKDCAVSLDNACGLCDLPLETVHSFNQDNSDVDAAIVVQAGAEQTSQSESAECNSEGEKQQFNEQSLAIKGGENLEEDIAEKSTLLSITDTEAKPILNPADKEEYIEPISNVIAKPPPVNDLGSVMYDTLKTLHKSMCQRKCKTFDRCIQNLLLRVIEENTITIEGTISEGIKGTKSITDLLETLHVKLCKRNCDNIEFCLNQHLGKIIKQHKTKCQIIKATKEIDAPELVSHKNTEFYTVANSNIVRSVHEPLKKSKLPMAQFKFLTEFPKSFETQTQSAKAELLNNTVLPPDELGLIECPVPNCEAQFDTMKSMEHLRDQHKNIAIEHISVGDCKDFFIDPSILEKHETECLLCYFVANRMDGHQEREGLPIFLQVCRTSLSKLYAPTDNPGAVSVSTQSSQEVEDQTIDAEIDEAIYGSNKKFKRKPVIWSNEDVLIIWPIAPIPHNNIVKTVMSVFLYNNPFFHRSISFYMRSMQHSREPFDVFGAPDALTLTNVEVEALTNCGQHAIQCQFMCNF